MKPEIPGPESIDPERIAAIAAAGDRRWQAEEARQQIAEEAGVGRDPSVYEDQTGRIPTPAEADQLRSAAGTDEPPRRTLRIGSWGKHINGPIKSDADLKRERELEETQRTIRGQRILAGMSESQRAAHQRGVAKARKALKNPGSQQI